MRSLGNVLIDQAHRQAWTCDPVLAAKMNPANPADASYEKMAAEAAAKGYRVSVNSSSQFSPALLADVDLLVIPHCSTDEWENTVGYGSPVFTESEIDSIEKFVASGGSLLVLAETEQPKYGNNLQSIAARFGIEVKNSTLQDVEHNHRGVPTWLLAEIPTSTAIDLGFKLDNVCLYRAGSLGIGSAPNAQVVLKASSVASEKEAVLAAAVEHRAGRVVVVADSDWLGDDSIEDVGNRQLWINLLDWLSCSRVVAADASVSGAKWPAADENWKRLASAIEALRPLQQKDGSIGGAEHSHEDATKLVSEVVSAVAGLAPKFPHQANYLEAAVKDIEAWRDGGFGVPDFYDSLEKFRPDLARIDGIEHLAVFGMYTQNGNPNRNLEAVITKTFWPDWLAEKEQTYNNAAFVPIQFVAFTDGYDTNSAVFFPETVAVRSVATYHWGGIFCDREAARFRRVAKAARELLYLALPPEAERLVSDQQLAQETFVLWDLIHDRTHSRGDLPFDPFMIKQRMPFWMYALEELRCDLSTFRETIALEAQGDGLAPYMRYAILFDRLFRFPITGGRVRNYDGLGGQIIFAHLHRVGALNWTDNKLSFDWDAVIPAMVDLCEMVESLYHDGINRSRLAQWIAAYEFVSGLVAPHPASVWAKGTQHLPTEGELREVVNLVMDDEFPLNVFFETLNRKLAGVIASTKGITA